MDFNTHWRDYFGRWPQAMARKGVLVTTFDQIPFVNFATSDAMILLERMAPDTSGARVVAVPYGNIQAVKFTDVINPNLYAEFGFKFPVRAKR